LVPWKPPHSASRKRLYKFGDVLSSQAGPGLVERPLTISPLASSS
jgi:hypothetical protein